MDARLNCIAILLIFHLSIAYSTFKFVSDRSQESNPEENVLCGMGIGGSAGEVVAARDGRTPKLTSAVTSSTALWREICELEFDKQETAEKKVDASIGVATGGTPRFEKFMMFFTDCWPHDLATDVFETFGDGAQIFLVDIPGAKYSHAIYTSYMTGQLATNYNGKPIEGDHLIKSLKRAKQGNFSLRYHGPEWSFLAILGRENYETFFDASLNISNEPLDQHFVHPYPFFFEPHSQSYWNSYSLSLAERGESMFAHSGVLDHQQHGEHIRLGPSGKNFPATERMGKTLSADIIKLKAWIDAHPDYLLVLASDHGVDEFDYSGYRMHGTSANGNEPWMLVYNPKLPAAGTQWIDIVDALPTLASFLKDVDIPINSLGYSRASFGSSEVGKRARAGMLKQNLIQLHKAAYQKGVWLDEGKAIELLKYPIGNNATALVSLLEKTLSEIKATLYTTASKPWLRLFFFVALTSFTSIATLFRYNSALYFFFEVRELISLIGELSKIVVIYLLPFIQIMFAWWNWGVVADHGFVYRTMAPALAALMLHNLHVATSPKMDKRSSVLSFETYIFRHELLNGVLQATVTCLPSLLSWIDGPASAVSSVVASLVALAVISRSAVLFRSQLGVLPKRSLFFMIFAFFLFSWTRLSGFYLFGFHFAALVVYACGIVVLPIYSIVRGNFVTLALSFACVMHFVSIDNPIRQLVVWLAVYQYFCLLLPSVECLRRMSRSACAARQQHDSEILLQALVAYFVNQAFFLFSFGLGDKINFDVHPYSGAIGMSAYDTFKALSAFLMALHKYGLFVILCCAGAALLFVPAWIKLEPLSHAAVRGAPTSSVRISDHLSTFLFFMVIATGMGFYLMYSVVTRHHPYEQAACMMFLCSFLGAFHSFLVLSALLRGKFLASRQSLIPVQAQREEE